MYLRLGYTGSNHILKNLFNITTARNATLKNIEVKGFYPLKEIAKANVQDLTDILKWNERENIKMHRISSNIIPQFSNHRLYNIDSNRANNYKKLNFIQDELREIRDYVKKHEHRITFHLPFYTKLASLDDNVLINSIYTIEQYAQLLDIICPDRGVLVIHVGGVYKDKKKTLQRWEYNYKYSLNNNVKKYLALENDEFNYSITDCLQLHEKCGVPIIYDLFHQQVYDEYGDWLQYVKPAYETWSGQRAKMHYSRQGQGPRGKHADKINELPISFMNYLDIHRIPVDLMLECKNSLESVLHLKELYHL